MAFRSIGACILLVSILLTGCGGKEERKNSHLERGIELFEEGNYQKARLEFRNVLQIDGKHIEARYRLGRTEENDQNWQAAFENYSAALELDPEHVDARIRRGSIYLLSGAADKALEEAQAALQRENRNADALLLRAAAKARLGNKDEAFSDARAALSFDPANEKALSLLAILHADRGEAEQAVAVIETGIAADPDNAALRMVLARVYEQLGDQEKMIGILVDLVALQPENLEHRLRLHAAYSRADMLDEAEATLEDAIRVDPGRVDSKLMMANFLVQKRTPERAERQVLAYIEEQPEAHRLRFGLARLYQYLNRPDDVVDVYRGIIQADETNADGLTARRLLAEHYFNVKEFDAAMGLANEVIAVSPNDGEALVIRAGIYLDLGEADAAVSDLRTVLRDNPNSALARRLLGRAHVLKNETALAQDNFRKALEINSQDGEAYVDLARVLAADGDADGAIEVFENMLDVTSDDLPVLQAMAQIRLQQSEFDQALRLAERMKIEFPDRAEGPYYAGLALQGLERFDESVKEFESSLELDPDSARPLAAMSRSLLATDEGDAGVERLDAVLAQNPDNFLVQNLLGEVFGVMRQGEAAEAAFLKAKKLRPDWPLPYRNLASLYGNREQLDKAISVLRDGVEATKGDASLRLQLASYLEQDGQAREAISEYENLLAQYPDVAVANNNLAMLLVDGEVEQIALDRALELVLKLKTDDNPYFRDTVGWVRYQRGEYEEAATELQIAAREASDVPVIHYHLGMAYFRLGRNQDAKRHLETAVSASTDFPGLDEARSTLQTL